MTGREVNTAPLPVDWSRFTHPVSTTCYCRCGATYRSHCKTVKHNEVWLLVTQRSCPGCGRADDCRLLLVVRIAKVGGLASWRVKPNKS